MIPVPEARKLILDHCPPPRVMEVPLLDAVGCVLAENIHSLVDAPPFDQSAMDGYAFSFEHWDGQGPLTIATEIQAGAFSSTPLKPMEAARIYTGAPLPPGADTVVMQEQVEKSSHSQFSILNPQLQKGANVRPKGSQTQAGALALAAGHLLNAPSISLIASIGIDKVKVFSKPKVGIIVTGKELTTPGTPISEGMIFESNSFGLIAALRQLDIVPTSVQIVDDVADEIKAAIAQQLHNDILIMTGGVSVGDYDLVVPALEECGVGKVFHKVKQKPGKPLFFGKHLDTLVFGLPGNPAAVLTCFYEYIVPAIGSFAHKEYLKKSQLPLAKEYHKKTGLTHFLKGQAADGRVQPLDGQESYLLNSFALANCLIELPAEQETFKEGEIVDILTIVP